MAFVAAVFQTSRPRSPARSPRPTMTRRKGEVEWKRGLAFGTLRVGESAHGESETGRPN